MIHKSEDTHAHKLNYVSARVKLWRVLLVLKSFTRSDLLALKAFTRSMLITKSILVTLRNSWFNLTTEHLYGTH
jgi:uncharacterized membrane protein YcjF (UPF0283 family)